MDLSDLINDGEVPIRPGEGSPGEQNTFSSSFASGYALDKLRNNNELVDRVRSHISDYMTQVEAATGSPLFKDFWNSTLDTYSRAGAYRPEATSYDWFDKYNPLHPEAGLNPQDRGKLFDELVNQVKSNNPNVNFPVKTWAQLRQEVETSYFTDKAKAEKEYEYSNWQHEWGMDDVGRFLGSAAGFLSDPRNLITALPLTLSKLSALTPQGLAANMVGSSALQALAESPMIDKLPGDKSETTKQVAIDSAVAGAFVGVFAVLGKGLSVAKQKLFSSGDAEAGLEIMQNTFKRGLDNVSQELNEVAKNIENPTVKAVARSLAQDMEDLHTYGVRTLEDYDQFRADLKGAYDAVTRGEVPPVKIQGDLLEEVNQRLADQGRYFGRNPEKYGLKEPTQLPTELQGLTPEELAARQEALRQQTARQIIEEQDGYHWFMNEEKFNTVKNDAAASRAKETTPSLDASTPYNPADTAAIENNLKLSAVEHGDNLKGYSLSSDFLGDAGNVEMGFARHQRHVEGRRNFLKELANCQINPGE